MPSPESPSLSNPGSRSSGGGSLSVQWGPYALLFFLASLRLIVYSSSSALFTTPSASLSSAPGVMSSMKACMRARG